MAEYLARAVADDGGLWFTSAGISAPVGAPASSGAVLAMAEVGIDLSDHRASEVWEIGPEADLIIALSREHLATMRRVWPERADSMCMLRPDDRSIADPYGQDTEAYRATRDEIAEAVSARAAAGWL
jgi:protein-tyrosine-phosphatase